MASRKPFPYINEIREHVINELIYRKQTFPVATAAPFVRLTSTKEDSSIGYKFFTLGLNGYTDAENLFDLVYGNRTDLVGYAYSVKDSTSGRLKKRLVYADELTKEASSITADVAALSPSAQDRLNQIQESRSQQQATVTAKGTHPAPGITSVSVSRRGIGTPISAQVTWVCYNRQQLEFLRNHFMIAGTYAVLEWGQQSSHKTIKKLLDFSDANGILDELQSCITGGRNYIIDTYSVPNDGNYDVFVGVVGNYTLSFDAHKNVYTITTTIYSTGEQYWGLSTYLTSLNIQQKPGITSTMYDFFVPDGSEFSRLCTDIQAIQQGYVSNISNLTDPNVVLNSKDLGLLGSYGDDTTFVRWDYFVTTILDKLFATIPSKEIQQSIQKFTSFYKLQESLDAESTVAAEEKNPRISYVGDSPELISCNPDSLVLIRGNKPSVAAFANGGLFGNGKFGVLGKGVWINANAIRRSFATTTTFDLAIRSLLTEMNLATAGFWNLRLFYDEDLALLKVVDDKHDSLPTKMTLYKFNVGTVGESIAIELESAFPPELITQLALAASFKTKTREERERLLRDYPLLGTTCHAGFALNWTNLVDILDQRIRGTTDTPTSADNILAMSPANTPEQPLDTRQRLGPVQTLPIVQNETNRAPDASIGSANLQTAAAPSDVMRPANITQSSIQLSAADSAMISRSKRYSQFIERWSHTYGVDANLIKAIIQNESGFDHTSWRQNASLYERYKTQTPTLLLDPRNSQVFGLGHVLGAKAKELGVYDLESFKTNPDEQARVTVMAFKSFYDSPFNRYTTEQERTRNAVSAYNGGFSVKNGFGAPFASDSTAPCIVWNEIDSTKCDKYGSSVVGQYGNQEYVNRVMNDYLKFKLSSEPPQQEQPTTEQEVVTQSSLDQQQTSQPTTQPTEQLVIEAEYRNKYGSSLMSVIEPNRSELMRRLLVEGMNRTPLPSNNFIAPFPTTSAVEISVTGISGMSVSDAFLVDKLPFIFEEYGCFQITEVSDTISTSGWITKIRGYFKFLWMDGNGSSDVGRINVVY